ncbi:MAG: hypothetical protein M1457_00665, partial [bacterium]|nr:hypothetical protein [bacterium]
SPDLQQIMIPCGRKCKRIEADIGVCIFVSQSFFSLLAARFLPRSIQDYPLVHISCQDSAISQLIHQAEPRLKKKIPGLAAPGRGNLRARKTDAALIEQTCTVYSHIAAFHTQMNIL